MASALEKCQHCKLEIPENTCTVHFAGDDGVVLMASAAAAGRASMEKLQLAPQAYKRP